MKILVGIPCYRNTHVTKLSIDSVINQKDIDILLIDNGAEEPVKELLKTYQQDNIKVLSLPENIYVNPAWNLIIENFLTSDCEYLIILNSDVIMQKDWIEILKSRWGIYPDEICLPRITDNIHILDNNISENIKEGTVVFGGTPGILITLNKKQAEIIYPIPNELKLWFGDLWIYTILRKRYKTIIVPNLLAYHVGSTNMQALPNVSEIIEQDKKTWETVKPQMENKYQ